MCCQIKLSVSRKFSSSVKKKEGMNMPKGWSDSFKVHCWVSLSSLVFPDFTQSKTQNSCQLKRGYILFMREGWTFCCGGTESKFHIEPYCPARRIRSIYLTCSLSTCFHCERTQWRVPLSREMKKQFFSLSLPIFFSVTMMLQVPWGT